MGYTNQSIIISTEELKYKNFTFYGKLHHSTLSVFYIRNPLTGVMVKFEYQTLHDKWMGITKDGLVLSFIDTI